ncbi:NAD(P)-dependent oxidoreductase [Benzoatithermus flavus]|uniref:NAD(P)-dependent oxidoreductase n=1 Tax=Benzoatithermus flavus TaxID=3108223 RepID=A0ABU8XNN9_9PROT
MPRSLRITTEPLIVIAELHFHPDHHDAVLELAQRHVRNTLAAEPGCLRFELTAPTDDPGSLIFYEMFASEAAFAEHQRSPHLAWFREARKPYVHDTTVRVLHPVSAVRPGIVLCAVPALMRHQDYLRPLVEAGFDLRWNDLGRVLTEDELIERLDGVVATIAGSEPYSARVFSQAPDLKVIARLGVGHDQIDVAAATRAGVAVAMAYGTNHDAVADHAMALLAAAAHRIVDYDRRVRTGGWGSLFHARIHGTTVGIVGFGRVGRALAKRCLGFTMDVLVADPVAEADTVARLGYQLVELDELLRRADFVSLHAPLTPETHHLIDARRLALMKPTAYLVNTSRGALVDQAALIEALEQKRIAGAALDVFEVEPLPESPLRRLDNVVLTPHVAGLSAASLRAMAERCVDSIVALTRGRDPGLGLVLNPEVLPSQT